MSQETSWKVFIGSLFALLSYCIKSLGALFWGYLFFVFCDIITGVLAAFSNGEFVSSISRKGLIKKIGTTILILLSVMLDYLITEYITPTNGIFYIGTCSAFIGVEGVSIAENLVKMGVKVPKIFMRGLKIVSGKGEEKDSI